MRKMIGKKGIYEFILTKSVMLIFILGLVGIFYTMYNNLNIDSAEGIAKSEAERLAKQIDDVIGFKGVSNTATIYLKNRLMVGKEAVPYSLEINPQGRVKVQFEAYPYKDIFGINRFGLKLAKSTTEPSADVITCSPTETSSGAFITISKKEDYFYEGEDYFYSVTVTIDAAESCREQMVFYQEFKEG